MKKTSAICMCVTLLVTFLSCNKIDWRPPTDCEVQQFGSPKGIFYYGPNNGPFPYLFSKTYDASGNVQSIDAYLFSLGIDFNLKSKFALNGQTLYCINFDNPTDTFMVVQLNPKGRPVKAVETRSLNSKSPLYPYFNYEFTYSKNKLFTVTTKANNNIARLDTCTYDSYGNILRLGRTSAYEYDYTQKPKQQFYFDGDNTSVVFYGFHFLEYLGFFPEITSPPNVRTIQRNETSLTGGYLFNFELANHKFDSQKKLISYDYGNVGSGNYKVTTPIIYNCGASGKGAQ